MTRTTAMGIVIGLALGLAVAFGNFGEMLIVALFGAIGFVVAKVLEGDLDLGPYLPRRRDTR
jgi:hypothetical protein